MGHSTQGHRAGGEEQCITQVHPNHWLICAQAQAAERTLWAPLNGLSLTFLDDELVDRVRTFELAVKDLA